MEIALASWHAPRALTTAHKGHLPGAQSGYQTSLPQFHVKLDSNFQTLREIGAWMPSSSWQIKYSFVQQPTKASHFNPVPKTRRTTMALPMQQPEGAQPTNNDEPQLVPEAKPNQDP